MKTLQAMVVQILAHSIPLDAVMDAEHHQAYYNCPATKIHDPANDQRTRAEVESNGEENSRYFSSHMVGHSPDRTQHILIL